MIKSKNVSLIFAILALVLIASSIVSAVTIKDAVTTPSEISPGETAKITIKIENTLNEDIKNVNVALDLSGNVPIAPYQESSEEYQDKIDEGDEETFSFDIIVLPEASSGVYKVPVQISYEINGTKETKNSTIGLIVNSPSKIKFSVEGYLIKGQEGKVELRIVNEGLSDLKFMSVDATQPSSGATINSPVYEYLGNLDSDDFETIEYTIYVETDTGSSILIPFKISYKDSTNKDFSQQENLKVQVYSLDEAKSLGLIPRANYTIYFIILLVPLIYIAYRIRKKMKRKKALGA